MRFLFAATTPDPVNNEAPTTNYDTNLPHALAGHDQLQQILTLVIGIAAALAVMMIVIAGLRFVLAQGNPQDTAKARNTIIYALIGLLIAITAEAIVSLTLGHL
jgi:type IV secretory pathway VirB2 component (pilin)